MKHYYSSLNFSKAKVFNFEFFVTIFSLTIISGFGTNVQAQAILSADGPGGTYDLINSVLTTTGNVVEVPDCGHGDFGEHIDEVWDADLNKYVFRFHAHVDEDDDRCINSDRQRIEIKTYDQSDDTLRGVENEIVIYKWKFKLDAGFQPSSSFTHIHQIKAVGGPEVSMPKITLTPRKSSTNKLQVRYAQNTTQVTVHEVPLAPFEGEWVQAEETVLYGETGTYSLVITRISDGAVLLNFSDNLRMWNTDAEFMRPKWGIYRSLNNAQDLRDEMVGFADFEIHENPGAVVPDPNGAGTCSTYIPMNIQAAPAGDSVVLSWVDAPNVDHYKIRYRLVGASTWITVPGSIRAETHTINALPNGTYEWQIRAKCSDATGTDYNDSAPPDFIIAAQLEFIISLWLEGPYNSTTSEMGTTLNTSRGLLPGQTPTSAIAMPTPSGQPYSIAPWNYMGDEGSNWTDADYSSDDVDWVLVSLRTGSQPADEVFKTAAILRKDGTLVFRNTISQNELTANELYIVVEHRNHIGIMSPTPVSIINNTLTFDFRASDSYRDATSFGQKQLANGNWVMYAGDGNQVNDVLSYDITGVDKSLWNESNGKFDSYQSADFNLDGDINGQDKTLWYANNGISSRVPR